MKLFKKKKTNEEKVISLVKTRKAAYFGDIIRNSVDHNRRWNKRNRCQRRSGRKLLKIGSIWLIQPHGSTWYQIKIVRWSPPTSDRRDGLGRRKPLLVWFKNYSLESFFFETFYFYFFHRITAQLKSVSDLKLLLTCSSGGELRACTNSNCT